MATLYSLTGEWLSLMDLLLDPDTDPELAKDTMEGLHGEIEDKLDNCAVVVKSLSANKDMVDKEIKRLQRWKKKLENNEKNMKSYMLRSMIAMDEKTIVTELNRFTVKSSPPALAIDDETLIPKEFKIPQPDKIDNAGLLKFLKELPEDKSVPYAHLEKENKSLLIK